MRYYIEFDRGNGHICIGTSVAEIYRPNFFILRTTVD